MREGAGVTGRTESCATGLSPLAADAAPAPTTAKNALFLGIITGVALVAMACLSLAGKRRKPWLRLFSAVQTGVGH